MMKHDLQFGKYRILQPLGSGGFAKVYLGEHIYLKTQAAIKVLDAGSDLSREEVQRFLKEARTIAQLRHPHITNILDFDVQNGTPYLVMEYAPNGSLYAHYPSKSVLEPRTALFYVKQVASALQFAHNHHVVHCDVKPENMLLNAQDQVLLSDFGIAVVLHSNLKTQGVVGTLHYMAPEQFVGKPAPASDQYGLAVVVYNWLCGQLPFNGKNALEIYHLHTEVLPRPLREINSKISYELDQVVLTALAKNPQERFGSISTFVRALEQAMQSKRFSAPAAVPSFSPLVKPRTHAHETTEPQPLLPSLSSLLPVAPLSQDQTVRPDSTPSAEYLPTVAAPVPETPAEQKPSAALDETPISASEQITLRATERSPTIAATLPSFKPPTLNSADMPVPGPGEVPILSSEVSPSIVPPISLPAPHSLGLALPLTKDSHLTYTRHTGWVSTVACSPDGRRIASGSWDGTVQVWDAAIGTTLLTYQGHAQPVKNVSWSPDGVFIASGSWDNTVQVWDAITGNMLPNKFHHEAQVEAVAWSPDGRHIASAGHDGILHVWRPSNKRTLFSYKGQRGPIWSVAWSPDSLYIAAASHDQTVRVWKALTGELVLVYDNHQQQVTAVTWSPDGRHIASGDNNGTVHVWSSVDGNTLLQYQDDAGAVKALGWSPDGTRLASAVKRVQGWCMTSPLPIAANFTYEGHTNWVNALAWSPDGHTIATASDDETVQLWFPG